MFLVIKITSVDKEGSLFRVMTSFGEGLLFLCVLLYLVILHKYLRYSILDVFVLLFFSFVSGTKIWIPSFVTIMK